MMGMTMWRWAVFFGKTSVWIRFQFAQGSSSDGVLTCTLTTKSYPAQFIMYLASNGHPPASAVPGFVL